MAKVSLLKTKTEIAAKYFDLNDIFSGIQHCDLAKYMKSASHQQ